MSNKSNSSNKVSPYNSSDSGEAESPGVVESRPESSQINRSESEQSYEDEHANLSKSIERPSRTRNVPVDKVQNQSTVKNDQVHLDVSKENKNQMRFKSSFDDTKKTKIQLTWKNIVITAPPRGRMCRGPPPGAKDFTIIDDVSGTVKPGQFLAIIGASGAGKTTLLNYLSGKDPSKNLRKEGQVLVNGQDRDSIDFGKYVAYVQQDDILFQTMTIRECLEFAARMSLPPTTDYNAKVSELIESLKLEKAADTKIGGPLVKGVSGGERKRTSIGVELITDPNLIFLDEPTTGLDSFTAQNVVEVLRALAASGRTVISTIHQPNSETFEQFDQLMLMANGHAIYMNDASKAVDYFASLGEQCPAATNPADFFMNMMSIEAMDDVDAEDQEEFVRRRTELEKSYEERINFFYTKYEESSLRCDENSVHPEAKSLDDEKTSTKYKPNRCKQLCLLLLRAFRNVFRLPIASYGKIMSYIIVSLIVLLVFGHLDHDQQSIQSRNGVMFMTLLLYIMNPIQGVILVFPDERPVFLREQGAQMYSPTMYFLSKILSELPVLVITATIAAILIYFPVGLNTEDASHFFIYYGYSLLLMMAATGMGLAGGVLVSNKNVAVGMIPVLVIPLMLLSGFFVNQDNYLPVLIPFEYISLFKYGFQVFTQNEYDGLPLSCRPQCDPLATLGFDETMEESIIATAALGFGFYLIAYILLRIMAHKAK